MTTPVDASRKRAASDSSGDSAHDGPASPHPRPTLKDVVARVGENGYTREVVRCVRVCKDIRANAQLWERVVNLQHVAVGDEVRRRTTPLIHWAAMNDVARVRVALDRGAHVDACDSCGFTALHYAYAGGDVAAELRARGAADGERARRGIANATRDSNTALVVDLVARGADVDSRYDAGGWTPMMFACNYGHAATVAELLRLGADVNAHENYDGLSSLTLAAWKGHIDVVRVLLAAPGVDINLAMGDDRHTALWWARHQGHASIVALLEAAGAH